MSSTIRRACAWLLVAALAATGLLVISTRAANASSEPSVIVGGSEVSESDGAATFPVTMWPASDSDVTFSFTTGDRTAHAGEDFIASTGTITIPAGDTASSITVALVDDEVLEDDEEFSMTISDADGATIGHGYAEVLLHDDEEPPTYVVPELVIGDGEAVESDGVITFPLTLSEPTTQTVIVEFTTVDSSASHRSDFQGTNSGYGFMPGQVNGTISIPLVGDRVPELTERFHIALIASYGLTIVDDRAEGTIHDDDPIRLPRLI